jgi:hypothetical protein
MARLGENWYGKSCGSRSPRPIYITGLTDLNPFGQDNSNHIVVSIEEQHGIIKATIER